MIQGPIQTQANNLQVRLKLAGLQKIHFCGVQISMLEMHFCPSEEQCLIIWRFGDER
jgi:hypothetical protein